MVTLALEEKYDQVRQLINMGKERGYLLYDEVNDLLPPEIHSSEEIDDLLSTFERYGIDVYEDLASAKAALAADSAEVAEPAAKEESPGDEGELDLTPGSLEKTNDPVRMYLREMGTVPLLTREYGSRPCSEVDLREPRGRLNGFDPVRAACSSDNPRHSEATCLWITAPVSRCSNCLSLAAPQVVLASNGSSHVPIRRRSQLVVYEYASPELAASARWAARERMYSRAIRGLFDEAEHAHVVVDHRELAHADRHA